MKISAGFCVAVFCGWMSAATCFAQCGQPACGSCQEFRIVYQTVYDVVQHTAYRIEQQTVLRPEVITSYRPVYETEMRERRYAVSRPVQETSEREEHYAVQRPIIETQMRDASYDRVRDVTEIVEQQQEYQVSRPIIETQERENRYLVRRPIMETAERDESVTVCEPVVNYTTRYVDQGCVVETPVCVAGRPRYRLRWEGAGCAADPITGLPEYHRAGLYWVQIPGPARQEIARSWQPNIVAQQVATTSYVQKVITRKVPVQVCHYVDEEVVQKVPVQVCRMVTETAVRRVPITVCRKVVEHVDQKVPVQVCRMVTEEQVRKVPVVTCRMVTEERVEQIPVQRCRMVAVQETVQVPQTIERQVPVTYTCRVPRMVVLKIPVEPACVAVPTTTLSPPIVIPTLPGPAAFAPPAPAISSQSFMVSSGAAFNAPPAITAGGAPVIVNRVDSSANGSSTVGNSNITAPNFYPGASSIVRRSDERSSNKPQLDGGKPLPGPAEDRPAEPNHDSAPSGAAIKGPTT